jgi:SAM-dependent methyltransferase
MNPNKALWEKGDFTRIAQSMRESGEALVKGLGVTKGLKVLDLGCGDGTTALPEAKLGADVLGVDIAGNLVEAGNRRAKEQDLTNCRFQEGDASNLHELKDHSFDLVVSIFGAMFAPKPFDVAREMVRVTRPGGRIVGRADIPQLVRDVRVCEGFRTQRDVRLESAMRAQADIGLAERRLIWQATEHEPLRRRMGDRSHGRARPAGRIGAIASESFVVSVPRPKFNWSHSFCEPVNAPLATKIVLRFQGPLVVVGCALRPPGWRRYRVHLGERRF